MKTVVIEELIADPRNLPRCARSSDISLCLLMRLRRYKDE